MDMLPNIGKKLLVGNKGQRKGKEPNLERMLGLTMKICLLTTNALDDRSDFVSPQSIFPIDHRT